MDLVHIWYDYRCWSKLLLSSIHTPAYDLEAKVTNLFYVKVLRQSFSDLLISKSLHDITLYLAW